ncbi:uncharacterized protein LOC122896021 [Neovison vison]|uniref:uncharacterized protein LOC122896021 n=1 Tax=Neovison vison TaxID=452646 RepID=UPI001CEFFA38|nr:uncharacterized protein LOC122896021 [Neogale vison]
MRNRSGPGKEEKSHSVLPPRPHHTPAAGHSGTQTGLSLRGVLGAHSAALHQPVLDPPGAAASQASLLLRRGIGVRLGLPGARGYPWLTAVTLTHKQNILSDFLAAQERATWGQHVTRSGWTPPRKTGHRPEGDAFQENPSEGSRGLGSGVWSESGQRPISALVPDGTAARSQEDTRERNQWSPLGRPPRPTLAAQEENPGKKGASPSDFSCWKPQVSARLTAMSLHSFTAPPQRGLPSHDTGCSLPGFLPCFLPTRLSGPSIRTEAPQGQRLLFTPNPLSSSASAQQPRSAAKLWKA